MRSTIFASYADRAIPRGVRGAPRLRARQHANPRPEFREAHSRHGRGSLARSSRNVDSPGNRLAHEVPHSSHPASPGPNVWAAKLALESASQSATVGGSRPRGKPRSAAGGAGAPHLPLLRGTFLSRRRNGRHAPAPLDSAACKWVATALRWSVGYTWLEPSEALGRSRCGRSAPSGARRPASQPYRCACTRARASAPA